MPDERLAVPLCRSSSAAQRPGRRRARLCSPVLPWRSAALAAWGAAEGVLGALRGSQASRPRDDRLLCTTGAPLGWRALATCPPPHQLRHPPKEGAGPWALPSLYTPLHLALLLILPSFRPHVHLPFTTSNVFDCLSQSFLAPNEGVTLWRVLVNSGGLRCSGTVCQAHWLLFQQLSGVSLL